MTQTHGRLAAVWLSCAIAAAQPQPRFLSFDEARETLTAFGRTDDAGTWDVWVRTQDREVRARIERGVEDSISNLILYGTSFTGLPRLDSPEAAVTSSGEVTEAARARVRAAAAAMARPDANERLRFAREYLARRGVPAKDVEASLAANLTRFAAEQRAYQEKLRSASASGDAQETLFVRATLFDQRAAMAISQNTGTTITALLPALFAIVAPPGSTNVPLTVGAIAFAITAIAAIAAFSARETFRVPVSDLGKADAAPMAKQDYDRLRAAAFGGTASA